MYVCMYIYWFCSKAKCLRISSSAKVKVFTEPGRFHRLCHQNLTQHSRLAGHEFRPPYSKRRMKRRRRSMQLLNYTTAILAVTENGWGARAPPVAARRCQRVQTDSKFGSLTAGRYRGRLVLTLAVSQVAHTPGSRFKKRESTWWSKSCLDKRCWQGSHIARGYNYA